MIHPTEWFRVTPDGGRLRWLFRRRLLMAWTPEQDWRLQIGLHWDQYGVQALASIGPLHLGWYWWRGDQGGGE